jgi:hypothetical protein
MKIEHDIDARKDDKIVVMRSMYGAEGYGWYWMLIEIMSKQKDCRLSIKQPHIYEVLSMELQTDPSTIEKFIGDCVKDFKLFKTDKEFVWTERLTRTLKKAERRTRLAKEAARLSWESRRAENNSNATAKQPHSKRKATASKFIKPTVIEVVKYFNEKGVHDKGEVEKFYDFYQSKGWMVGKNKMKDWKAAIRNWLKGYNKGNKRGMVY